MFASESELDFYRGSSNVTNPIPTAPSESVQVFVRIRPPFGSELEDYIFNPGMHDEATSA